MRNFLAWTSSRTVHEVCMYTIQAIDIEWKTLPLFDPSHKGYTAEINYMHALQLV